MVGTSMQLLKIISLLLVSLNFSAYAQTNRATKKDSLPFPQEISLAQANKLAKKQKESKVATTIKENNIWSVFESNAEEFNTSLCYWKVTVQNQQTKAQIILQEKDMDCNRSYVLDYEPTLLDKNTFIFDLPSERGGVFYIFVLTPQGKIKWNRQYYMSLDEDGLNIKKQGETIYIKTFTDKYVIYPNKSPNSIIIVKQKGVK